MKKVLLISDLFPHKYSPYSEVFVLQQAEVMAKHYQVSVIATRFKYKYAVEQGIKSTYNVTYIFMPILNHVYEQ
jgi:hypothetical protein